MLFDNPFTADYIGLSDKDVKALTKFAKSYSAGAMGKVDKRTLTKEAIRHLETFGFLDEDGNIQTVRAPYHQVLPIEVIWNLVKPMIPSDGIGISIMKKEGWKDLNLYPSTSRLHSSNDETEMEETLFALDQYGYIRFQAAGSVWDISKLRNPRKPKLGTGKRFQQCVKKVSKRKGVYDPEGLCAHIGREKYGKQKFQKLAIRGRKKAKNVHNPLGFSIPKTITEGTGFAIGSAIGSMVIEPILDQSKKLIKKLRNPQDRATLEAAVQLAESFHGRPIREVIEVEEENHFDDNLAVLGVLVEMGVSGIDDDEHEIELTWNKWGDPNEAVLLASDPEGKNLHFVGGDQDLELDNVIDDPNVREAYQQWGKNIIPIGYVNRIVYFTDKHHLAGGNDQKKGVQYEHFLGEDDGNRPLLMYDLTNRKMHLAGGAYIVEPEGIVN